MSSTGYAYLVEVAPFQSCDVTARGLARYFAGRSQMAFVEMAESDAPVVAAADRFNALASTAFLLRVLAETSAAAADDIADRLAEYLRAGETLPELVWEWLAADGIDPARITR